ncbi:hypothetical protein BD289DRAFT_421568 [Coniella lustricola]|uniref:Uncharacterized protein n=1 Tax=Coniella lustricola TaxID=2025994 RepID=A0A2T3ALQ7_9PEZI|nr:hypothetical protein BD289DRAFT_421568 [Coniella lustricola]
MFRCFAGIRTRALQLAPWSSSPFAALGSRGLKITRPKPVNYDSNDQSITTHGKQLLATLASHDIGLYAEMDTVKHLHWNGNVVRIAARHVAHAYHQRFFTEVANAYGDSAVKRMLDDHAKPLWYYSAMKGENMRPIVRGKAEYRLNGAFHQALRNAGYDNGGRRLSKDAQREHSKVLGRAIQFDARTREIAQLFATVEIIGRFPNQVKSCPFSDLRDFCTTIVQYLENNHGKTWDGRRVLSIAANTGRPHFRQQARPQGGGGGGGGGQRGNLVHRPGYGGQQRQRSWE